MTETDYLAIAAKGDWTGFTFARTREGATTAFLAPAGATLRFASKDTDTLTIPGLPAGFLASGDSVTVSYMGRAVFVGDVASVERTHFPGSDTRERVVCAGPWAKMARLVYRQLWRTGPNSWDRSSRLVLNQYHSTGRSQSLNSELAEIANWGATGCGYTVGSVSVSTQHLPFDECRDITVADAIRRELRLFPKAFTRFSYSGSRVRLNIMRADTSGEDAAYMASVPEEERQRVWDANPIDGVDLEFETVSEVNGVKYVTIDHQKAGNTATTNPNCLYATVRVDGGAASTVAGSFTSITEDVPADWNSSTAWWFEKHPRLKGLATSAVSIVQGSGERSDAGETEQYQRISEATAGEIEAAGLKCRVVTFSVKVNIATTDDEEDEVTLSMSFLATNAEGTKASPKKYTWVAASSSESGERVPSGLAGAILADRSGALRSMKARLALKEAANGARVWPLVGDVCEGLILQTVEVDCQTCVATLDFGAPEHIAPEDMAALLTNFRNKRKIASSTLRAEGTAGTGGDTVELGGIAPLFATDWQPGKTAKRTFSRTASSSGESGGSGGSGSNGGNSVVVDATGEGGNVRISTGDLDSEQTASFRTISWTDSTGTAKTAKFLGTEDVVVTGGAGKGDGVSIDLKPQTQSGPSGESAESSESGESGESTSRKLEIKGFGAPQASAKTAYQIPCDIPPSGGDALLDSEQSDGLLFLARKGTPTGSNAETESEPSLAYVKLSGKAMHEIQAVTGVSLAVSNGKLVMTLTKRRFHVPQIAIPAASEIESEDIDILTVESLEVVTGETYTPSTRSFSNTRKRVTVFGPVTDAAGQTPFTATPISEEV